ncbi:MAG: S41 family peptidase [bacterium]|nr:S41 family peptidase [bacterium]
MKKIIYVLICMVSILFPTITNVDEKKPTSTPDEAQLDQAMYDWSRNFAHVLQLAKEKHFKIVDVEKSMIKAIDAFLTDLDPHSGFLDPKTYKSMLESTSGEFFGIGIVIDNTRKAKDKFLTIVDTIPNGPADKASVLPMDKIIEVDNQSLEGLTTEEVTAKIKGERNTQVNIKVMRENHQDLLSFDIVRDVVQEQTALSFYIKNHNIYYLSLAMFSDNASKQLENLLKNSATQKYKGIILDLRNNSGGLLDSAIEIAGLFLEKGSLVVITKDKNNKIIEQYKTSRNPVADNSVPIFILTNNYTASAAEILAGCLKVHSEKYALTRNGTKQLLPIFLLGTKTFGKGSVQKVIPIADNCAVKLTTELYYLPNDTTIQGTGIEPDFIIEKTYPPTEQIQWFTKVYGREQALENSIKPTPETEKTDAKTTKMDESKKEDKSKVNRWQERAKEMLQKDNQLRETITLINLLETAQQLCPDNVCTREKSIDFLKHNYITNETLDIEQVKA